MLLPHGSGGIRCSSLRFRGYGSPDEGPAVRSIAIAGALVLLVAAHGSASAQKLPWPESSSVEATREDASAATWPKVEEDLRPSSPSPPAVQDGGSNAATAIVISTSPYQDTGTTQGKGNNALLPSCANGGNDTAEDAWYKVTLTQAGVIDAWTCSGSGETFDTRLGVFNQSLSLLTCNDDDPTCGRESRISDLAVGPGTYYIVVDGWNGASGSYELNVQWETTGTIVDLIPDVTTRTNELYDHDIVTNIVPGRTHLRLSNATANIGLGKLHMYGVFPDNGDGTQDVRQRIFRSDGTYFDRDAGAFLYHPGHAHIHFDDWAIYRLRTVAAGGGVGGIVVEGAKTSYCILDGLVHDNSLPGFPSSPEFTTCGSNLQGLSVGWADIYTKNLEGQNLDITGIPAGQYWLESEADPFNHILETDETNNIARILVTIGNPGAINPDPYEPNNQISDLASRPAGGPNSPVLGPCAPLKTVSGLTLHASGNDDYFRFYMPARGGIGDEVRIDFPHAAGDLELAILNAAGTLLEVSSSTRSYERIGIRDFPAGWYYLRVYGASGATSPGYALTINPSQNGTPSITVSNPPAGDVRVPEFGSYSTTWTASDPEANETWVDVYVNTSPVLDGSEIFLPGSQATPGSQGLYVINPAEIPEGTYYVYTSITDGGTFAGDWSTGTITIVPVTGVEGSTVEVPWRLLPTSPNPFNPHTLVRLQVPRETRVSWRIHDTRGALVRTLARGALPAGVHTRTWDGRDDRGRDVASGTYYMIVEAQGYTGRQKVTLLR
jgi:hypothetical protein